MLRVVLCAKQFNVSIMAFHIITFLVLLLLLNKHHMMNVWEGTCFCLVQNPRCWIASPVRIDSDISQNWHSHVRVCFQAEWQHRNAYKKYRNYCDSLSHIYIQMKYYYNIKYKLDKNKMMMNTLDNTKILHFSNWISSLLSSPGIQYKNVALEDVTYKVSYYNF